MDDGARTHDHRNHNPGLYQLSYIHHNLARPAGFEPATYGLEGRCSIQLSYGRKIVTASYQRPSWPQTLLFLHHFATKSVKKWSGWRDSNSRPSAPKADALPSCATPRSAKGGMIPTPFQRVNWQNPVCSSCSAVRLSHAQ